MRCGFDMEPWALEDGPIPHYREGYKYTIIWSSKSKDYH